jgi:tRNA threonylcarbamoyladenosine biosynthesis protein TsaB
MADDCGVSARLLGLETSTDACSIALCLDGTLVERHVEEPRQHSRLLIPLLRELLDGRALQSLGLQGIAFGAGPGSFTGLRIAASAAQGLAFSLGVPVLPVATLACQAAGALRERRCPPGAALLSTLDARIGQLYWALYVAGPAGLEECLPPAVCAPGDLPLQRIREAVADAPLHALGSGVGLLEAGSGDASFASLQPDISPRARDLLSLAESLLARGGAVAPADAAPLYVQAENRWKKLPEQGPRA